MVTFRVEKICAILFIKGIKALVEEEARKEN